jgi:hypothetical protein
MEQTIANVGIGSQVYLEEGDDPRGAVFVVAPSGRNEIIVYVENSGEFIGSADAIRAAHDGKVRARLDKPLLDAIAHAHDAEVSGSLNARSAICPQSHSRH